jgi:hypothetical protein
VNETAQALVEPSMHRLTLVVLATALVVSSCGTTDGTAESPDGSPSTPVSTGGVDTTTPPAAEERPPSVTLPAPGTLPSGPSALDDADSAEFPEPLVAVADIISGGPPPDGIPPIDDPQFLPISAVDWLSAQEAVVVVEIGGDARAYPAQVLIWHEIVNDVVGDLPISVTYCPLCSSAVAYERTINGVTTTFGTSGRLYKSALVMYDRATESLWTHYDGTAVVGVLTGVELERVAAPLMAYGDFTAAYPQGVVLDRSATGWTRDYGRNPYVGYDSSSFPFLFRGTVDDRAAAMRRVVGVSLEDVSVAWVLDAVSGDGPTVTNTTVGEIPIVILWQPGQVSVLDTADTGSGIEVGSVGVFRTELDGRILSFAVGADGFTDVETGTRWNVAGHAVEGELVGLQLERVVHLDTFWFAWSTYQPGTDLVEE